MSTPAHGSVHNLYTCHVQGQTPSRAAPPVNAVTGHPQGVEPAANLCCARTATHLRLLQRSPADIQNPCTAVHLSTAQVYMLKCLRNVHASSSAAAFAVPPVQLPMYLQARTEAKNAAQLLHSSCYDDQSLLCSTRAQPRALKRHSCSIYAVTTDLAFASSFPGRPCAAAQLHAATSVEWVAPLLNGSPHCMGCSFASVQTQPMRL
jgi:hypothetical protein